MTTKREQTRRRILQAAWQLFREQGYQQSSTRAIARAAGVADGTVFSHFNTKLDMLKAGIMAQIDAVLEQAEEQLTATEPAQRLLHFAGYLYPFYSQHAEFSREFLGALLWHQEELRPQVEAFIVKLFPQELSEENRLQGQIMMDCYFMTLLEGLGQQSCDASEMLALLDKKLNAISR